MEKFFGDFLQFLGTLLVFLFLLLRQLKKKPSAEEPQSETEDQGISQEKIVVSTISEPSPETVALGSDTKERGRAIPVPKPKVSLSPRKAHARQLVLSYEILSKPLSLRVPRV